MIRLSLDDGVGGPKVELGPAPWFRLAGNFIRQGPAGEIVGCFRNHYWEVQSRRYIRYFCDAPLSIDFEDIAGAEGVRLGPYTKLWVEDGVLHVDGQLKAKFHEESQIWHCYECATYWPSMVIRSAAIP